MPRIEHSLALNKHFKLNLNANQPAPNQVSWSEKDVKKLESFNYRGDPAIASQYRDMMNSFTSPGQIILHNRNKESLALFSKKLNKIPDVDKEALEEWAKAEFKDRIHLASESPDEFKSAKSALEWNLKRATSKQDRFRQHQTKLFEHQNQKAILDQDHLEYWGKMIDMSRMSSPSPPALNQMSNLDQDHPEYWGKMIDLSRMSSPSPPAPKSNVKPGPGPSRVLGENDRSIKNGVALDGESSPSPPAPKSNVKPGPGPSR
ncbi:hypothetical protein PPACK8108_LOCUS26367, partial [Phakopsora pachyrhizi]